MIRISFFSLALCGVLFSNTALASGPQDDIQCKVEQDQVNTAVFVEGKISQTYRACNKGTIANLEVIAEIEFNGGTVDMAIMDAHFTTRALKTFTAENYNGTSLVMENLSIPTFKNDGYTIMIKTFDGASMVMPATDDPTQFVGESRLGSTALDKNLKFTTGIRASAPDLDAASEGRGDSNGPVLSAQARTAAGLDLAVSGDCASAQRLSTGVLNFVGETFIQRFQTCDRGRIGEIKMATPFVEPGFAFEYALLRTDYSVIADGTFTTEDVTDGELLLTFEKASVRKGQTVMLKISCPQGARIAALAKGAEDNGFGKLYVNSQSVPYNLCMAAGLDAATASDVVATHNGRDEIEIGAYPVPFGESLSITIRGIVQEGAALQLLNHQGRPVRVVSLAGGKLDAPVRFRELHNLRPGLYTIRLHNGDTVVSKRILKG